MEPKTASSKSNAKNEQVKRDSYGIEDANEVAVDNSGLKINPERHHAIEIPIYVNGRVVSILDMTLKRNKYLAQFSAAFQVYSKYRGRDRSEPFTRALHWASHVCARTGH